MGNRAYVVFVKNSAKAEHAANNGIENWSPAVYLHWNGGPESVYAFLVELHRRHVRADQCYECARFAQIVGDFFDCGDKLSTLSLGINNLPDCKGATLKQWDPGDNGFYLVERGSQTDPLGIVSVRRFFDGEEQSAEWVEKERAGAVAHEYAAGIAENFKEITKAKPVECCG